MENSTNSAPKPVHRTEATFKNFKAADADNYAAHRTAYPRQLIDIVVQSHISSGGQTQCLLDIGCGPGIATRQIAPYFQHIIGIDASSAMIQKAQQSNCLSSSGEEATFKVCSSEDIDQHFEPESVDLITVATAAHWFDMPRFYAAASKILKPSGTIAMWVSGRWYPDPRTTPNIEAIIALWDRMEAEIMKPYEEPGNLLARNIYRDLDLPWTIDVSSQPADIAEALSQYDQQASSRREFNADGVPDPSPEFAETRGFIAYFKTTLDIIGKRLSTSSPIHRWREAHKEQLERGEVEDCVEQMMKATRAEMGNASSNWEGRDWVEVGCAAALIVVKKKKKAQ